MKDRDLFNQLEESVPEIKESKERTWKRIVAETGYSTETKKSSKFVFKKWMAFASAAVIICLLIPIAIIMFRPEEVENRFCSSSDYRLEIVETHLADFAKENPDLLFFNWAESEASTNRYIDVNDETVCFGINEIIYNVETDTEIKIDVIYPEYVFEEIEAIRDNAIYNVEIENINVSWFSSSTSANIVFNYKRYTYCLYFYTGIDENTVISTVAELLSSRN